MRTARFAGTPRRQSGCRNARSRRGLAVLGRSRPVDSTVALSLGHWVTGPSSCHQREDPATWTDGRSDCREGPSTTWPDPRPARRRLDCGRSVARLRRAERTSLRRCSPVRCRRTDRWSDTRCAILNSFLIGKNIYPSCAQVNYTACLFLVNERHRGSAFRAEGFKSQRQGAGAADGAGAR